MIQVNVSAFLTRHQGANVLVQKIAGARIAVERSTDRLYFALKCWPVSACRLDQVDVALSTNWSGRSINELLDLSQTRPIFLRSDNTPTVGEAFQQTKRPPQSIRIRSAIASPTRNNAGEANKKSFGIDPNANERARYAASDSLSLALIVAFGVLVYGAKRFFTTDLLNEYGHYRGKSVAEIAAEKPRYKGSAYCTSCHAQQVAEWSNGVHNRPDIGKVVKCEVCHGPGGGRDPETTYLPPTTGPDHPKKVLK